MAFRNAAVCAGSQTATGGRSPVRRHSCTRAAVHTTARGRRAGGSSAPHAGLAARYPARIAALSAARSVALIRFSVAAVTGLPWAARCRVIAVNMAWTCAALRSASRIWPRYGSRYSRTCEA